jgi:hypothetical protein
MPPVVFEPTISAGERPKTYTLDRTATRIGVCTVYKHMNVLWGRMWNILMLNLSVRNVKTEISIMNAVVCFDYFDVVTSIVSFIWAPSTRGGVAYGVRTLSTNRNSY